MHRREGDFGNAVLVPEKSAHIRYSMNCDWSDDNGHDPFDLSTNAVTPRGTQDRDVPAVPTYQWAEWQAPMMHCLDC